MVRRLLLVLTVMMLGSCNQKIVPPGAGQFRPTINAALAPLQSAVPDAQGTPRPVAASRDAQGVQSDFVESLVLVRPSSQSDLDAFLSRYGGTVLRDDTIPEPPPSLGITLTADQRGPKEYLVRINLSKVDVANFTTNATAAGLTGILEFSSQNGLQTLAAVADAVATGFDASPDYVSRPKRSRTNNLNDSLMRCDRIVPFPVELRGG